jgi:hypothetical protein
VHRSPGRARLAVKPLRRESTETKHLDISMQCGWCVYICVAIRWPHRQSASYKCLWSRWSFNRGPCVRPASLAAGSARRRDHRASCSLAKSKCPSPVASAMSAKASAPSPNLGRRRWLAAGAQLVSNQWKIGAGSSLYALTTQKCEPDRHTAQRGKPSNRNPKKHVVSLHPPPREVHPTQHETAKR